ncbi:MAG: hypothetical protein OXM61_17410 [Candidatus Poribacteria bacterium]|nr:hypothetical protein [Candidatus Poribacteria bacterium]
MERRYSPMLMGVAWLLLIIGIIANHTIWRPIGITAGIVWSLASLVVGARYWPAQFISVFFFWIISFVIGKVIQLIIKGISKKKENPDPDAAYKPPTNKVEPFMFKSFFLDPNYRKFAYRLLGSISGIIVIVLILIISNDGSDWDEWDLIGSLIIGLLIPLAVFGLYYLIRWVLRALPNTHP